MKAAIDSHRSRVRSSGMGPTLVLSMAAFLVLVGLDWASGFLLALRFLYLLPIWLATRLGGRRCGLVLVGITSVWLAYQEVVKGEFGPTGAVNLALRTSTLVVLTLIIAQVEEALRRSQILATRDSLTGLSNRLALGEMARRAIDRARRTRRPLAVVLFDCDRFKAINDTHGHAAGDQVLRLAARALTETARSTDVVARLGGDEFVAVLPRTSRIGAKVFAERALAAFAELAARAGYEVSLSYGTAELAKEGRTLENLLAAADREMYRRKNRGRIFAEIRSR
jgi:diguanylate cyclase (GGDEF)-like protein